jgi:hypothetical protein
MLFKIQEINPERCHMPLYVPLMIKDNETR